MASVEERVLMLTAQKGKKRKQTMGDVCLNEEVTKCHIIRRHIQTSSARASSNWSAGVV